MTTHRSDMKQRGRHKSPGYGPAYRRAMVKARTKAERKPIVNPGVHLQPDASASAHGWTWGPVYKGDDEFFWLQLHEAFGTRSGAVIDTFMDQLIELSDGQRPSPALLNAAISIIGSYQPKNEGEAMLAAQMVAVHTLTMKAGAYVNMNGRWSIPAKEASLVFKGARTFAEQTDTMARLKGRQRTQRIEVYYHHDARQIVEGDVHVHRGGAESGSPTRSAKDGPSRAHAREADAIEAGEYAIRPALRGPDPERLALPRPEGEGPFAMPLARLRAWIRRATGGSQRSVQARGLDRGGEADAPAVVGRHARLSESEA